MISFSRAARIGRFPLLVARLVIAMAGLMGMREIQAAPEVQKVEPPSWWAGHSLNPVRVMMRGQDLAGAHVEAAGEGLRAGNVRVNAAGTYLFVDVTINPSAKPGAYRLNIVTAEEGTTAPFEVLQPLAPAGRFQGFSNDDVIYLIMPDRFADGDSANDDPIVSRGLFNPQKSRYYHGGDFQGIINHLSYLKELGVTALWLTPWYDNVNHANQREKYSSENRLDAHGEAITDYHGYGAVDFYGVEEHFGDLAKLKALTDAAHHLGIKIIQDEVANHTGPYHPWVTNSPTATWYNGTLEKHLANNWQTWSLTVPDAPADQRRQTLEGWFIDILPDLNQGDEECSRYLIQNSLWWVGTTGMDGIRLDTLPYVPRSFWHDWRAAVGRQYPQLNVVGEMYDGDARKVAFFQGGCARFDSVDSGIESLFDFPLFYAIRRAFIEGKSMKELTNVLAQDSLYVDSQRLVTFLGLHDVERFMNKGDSAGLAMAFTFLLTTRGIPMIYYGDEIGLRGGGDPDNRRDFPGGFPNGARNAFETAGRTPEERVIFDRVKQLLHLRAEFEPLRHGRIMNLEVGDNRYAFARTMTTGTALVLLNTATVAQSLELQMQPLGLGDGTIFRDRLGLAGEIQVKGGKIKITLEPRSAAVYTTINASNGK